MAIMEFITGLVVGGLSVGIYYYRKNSKLQSTILDKFTIIKLIKDHVAQLEKSTKRSKSKSNGRKNYRKTRRPAKKSTAGMKQVRLK